MLPCRCRTERLLASGFFRAKMAQENLIKAPRFPTQLSARRSSSNSFKGIADFSTDGNKVRLPTALIQPMAADDVASAVAGSRQARQRMAPLK